MSWLDASVLPDPLCACIVCVHLCVLSVPVWDYSTGRVGGPLVCCEIKLKDWVEGEWNWEGSHTHKHTHTHIHTDTQSSSWNLFLHAHKYPCYDWVFGVSWLCFVHVHSLSRFQKPGYTTWNISIENRILWYLNTLSSFGNCFIVSELGRHLHIDDQKPGYCEDHVYRDVNNQFMFHVNVISWIRSKSG